MSKAKSKHIKAHIDITGKVNLAEGTYLSVRENLKKDGYKDSFAMVFSRIHLQLFQLRTITAYKVYFTLFILLIERGTHELEITQKQLSDYIGCAGAEVSKAVAELEKVKLIHHHARGKIVLNPKYVWRGSLLSWQETVENLSNTKNEELI
jgi:hypothetical protein